MLKNDFSRAKVCVFELTGFKVDDKFRVEGLILIAHFVMQVGPSAAAGATLRTR